jgi:inner membrane transporter RhtA
MMLAELSVLLGMASVQLGASFAKGLFPLVGPAPTVMLRTSIAAIVLAIIWRPWRAHLNKRSLKAIILYGTCLGFMNLAFYLALTRIPLGICVALEFTGPLAVALLASKQKIDFIWAFLAAVGIVFIMPWKTGYGHLDLEGIFLALLAGLCWAFYIVFGTRLGSIIHGGFASSLGMIVASLCTLPFGLISVRFSDLTPTVLSIGTGVAILSSAIPYTIEMFAMKQIPTKTFGILMSVEPGIAAIFGLFILKEHLQVVQWFAIACVVIASAGSAKTSKSHFQPVDTAA